MIDSYSSGNAHLDELLDQRQVQHVRQLLRKRLNGHLNLGHTHKRDCEVPDEWRVLDELHAQADRGNEAFDNSVNRDGDVEPVKRADEELEGNVHVVEAQLARLTR